MTVAPAEPSSFDIDAAGPHPEWACMSTAATALSRFLTFDRADVKIGAV